MKKGISPLIIASIVSIVFISINVSAGKLYIKPNLERKRAERLLDEANADFRNGKIHITLSPEIAYTEFELSRDRYIQAVKIIEKYGAGFYTPGDVEDFESRVRECEVWIRKAKSKLK